MPLTFTITEGVLPSGSEKSTFTRLCAAMLKWHGLAGNSVMTPNVIGSIQLLKLEQSFAGLTQAPVAFVEWKVPSFAFADPTIQRGYVDEATQIVHEASGGRLPKDHIWCNVVHAVDGAWGIAGQALSNRELGERVAQGGR